MLKEEKRKCHRIKDENISLKVKTDGIDIITKTLDISASGVYCKVSREIPLLSRIKILLILPKPGRISSKDGKSTKIETEGVIVREHPVVIDGRIDHYDVAIFFNNISLKDKKRLQEYVNSKQTYQK